MADEEQQNRSLAAKAAWPLLVLTAVLQVYLGLSVVAYTFTGILQPASGPGAWMVAAMGGLQVVAAVVAFVLATRRDLRGATLAVAGSILLGWLSTLPSIDIHGDDKGSPIYFGGSALFAIAGATLACRKGYPTAAALLVSAMSIVGILVVLAFAIIIAMYGL
jgi:hypothetical protein